MEFCSERVKNRAATKTKKKKEIHGDLIAEILSRLPIKSVVRFGIASHSFLEIVSDRGFQHSHFNRSSLANNSVMALTQRMKNGPIIINLSHGRLSHFDSAFGHINTSSKQIDYANTCNGLLCFQFTCDREDRGSVLICNPITGELVFLPPPPPPPPPAVADADNNKYSVGLGFSPPTHPGVQNTPPFLLITISSQGGRGLQPLMFPLSVETTRGGGELDICPPDRKPVYAGGKIHWFHRKRVLLSFDVESESFVTTAKPPYPEFGPDTTLLELGGNLSLAALADLSLGSRIRLWVLKDDQWEVRCVIPTPEPIESFKPGLSRLTSMWERGGCLLVLLQDDCFTYDLQTKEKRQLLGGVYHYSLYCNRWELLRIQDEPDFNPQDLSSWCC